MKLFNALIGNASEINVEELEKEFQRILGDNEKIEKGFILVRDLFVFTNKRLILVDKQGLTGKKKQYHSIPYRSVTHFTVETLGHFDLDSELKIWIHGSENPESFHFRKDSSILEIQRTLASYL